MAQVKSGVKSGQFKSSQVTHVQSCHPAHPKPHHRMSLDATRPDGRLQHIANVPLKLYPRHRERSDVPISRDLRQRRHSHYFGPVPHTQSMQESEVCAFYACSQGNVCMHCVSLCSRPWPLTGCVRRGQTERVVRIVGQFAKLFRPLLQPRVPILPQIKPNRATSNQANSANSAQLKSTQAKACVKCSNH